MAKKVNCGPRFSVQNHTVIHLSLSLHLLSKGSYKVTNFAAVVVVVACALYIRKLCKALLVQEMLKYK